MIGRLPEIFKTKSKADIFEVLNAVLYLIKTGCQWKLLPNDFPKWGTVYEKLPSLRSIVMHLRPLVSVTMQPHCSLTARIYLHDT
ncbi:MAG: transposase [Muribaculaceae bacterium]|nr:transposase [Muribaculaceae bacterium]